MRKKSSMTQQPSTLFNDEDRLRILRATQRGDIATVKSMLGENSVLIHSTSTTRKSTLLHLAAQSGCREICKLLLARGHLTNPTNNNGETPYQLAKDESIKEMIAKTHMKNLSELHYSAKRTERISLLIEVKKPLEYREFIRTKTAGGADLEEKSRETFGVTFYDSSSASIITVFRADILMIPYYGELLVLHENEQVIQLMELLQQPYGQQLVNSTAHAKQLVMIEARAFIQSIAAFTERYPFLREPIGKTGEKADVTEAKKMMIAFALLGLATHLYDCDGRQTAALAQLPQYKNVVDYLLKRTISEANAKRNEAIYEEMSHKYYLPASSLSHANEERSSYQGPR